MTVAAPPFEPVIVHSRGDIASVLAGLRRAMGLTIERFDVHAGFSDRYTAKLEHGDTPSGRQGFQIAPDRVTVSAMAEIWLEALGARLVLMPAEMAEAIGAKPAPKREGA